MGMDGWEGAVGGMMLTGVARVGLHGMQSLRSTHADFGSTVRSGRTPEAMQWGRATPDPTYSPRQAFEAVASGRDNPVQNPRGREQGLVHRAAEGVVSGVVHEGIGRVASPEVYAKSRAWADRHGFRACFTAGTPLVGRDGAKPIEAFRSYEDHGVGCDWVVSQDEFNDDGPLVFRRVLKRFERMSTVLDVTIGGRVIGTTAEHPFYRKGDGWVPAHELRPGDAVRVMAPGWVTVERVEDTGRVETVYNIEVEDDHTYFVGADGWGFSVWAHNEYVNRSYAVAPFGN